MAAMASPSMPESRQQVLEDVYMALQAWIPKRKETVQAMENAADEIRRIAQRDDTFKMEGDAVSAAAGIFGTILGAVAILSTGGSD